MKTRVNSLLMFAIIAALILSACGGGGGGGFTIGANTLTVSVVYGSEKQEWLKPLADQYNAAKHQVNGSTIVIEATAMGSIEAVNGIIRPDDLALPTGFETPPELRPAIQSGSLNLNLDAVIQQHVQYVLDLNRGNKLRAARQLGISRSTLYRILGDETILAQ